jgi:hypothetical protein
MKKNSKKPKFEKAQVRKSPSSKKPKFEKAQSSCQVQLQPYRFQEETHDPSPEGSRSE